MPEEPEYTGAKKLGTQKIWHPKILGPKSCGPGQTRRLTGTAGALDL